MKNKSTVTFIIAFFFIGLYMGHQASAKPADSLRVGAMMKEMNKLIGTVQDSIIADLKGDEKKKLKGMVSELDKIMKRAGTMFKDTMLADFSKLSDEEKGVLREIESAVLKIRNAVNEKSTDYHLVAKAYIPVYKAAQSLRADGRDPMLATYREPYNPNTSKDRQVIMLGAYLNFYLEYQIKVGGMNMGPDIVDADRLVFTFPEKLLEGITEPTYIEVVAAPKKQTGVGASAKFENNPEQHAWVLVYPVKK